MALPLPRVVPDTGPGGGLVTAMGGINALHNAMIEKKINQIKAQYMPLTSQAEAASKLAYANLMGPQFLSKLLGNEGALANMSEDQKKQILGLVSRAGVNNSGNPLAQMPQAQAPQHTGVGQPSTNNFAGYLKNALKGFLGQGQSQGQGNNPFAQAAQAMPQMPQQQQMPQGQPQAPEQPMGNPAMNAVPGKRPKGGVTVEGQQWYDKNGNPVYEEDVQTPNEDVQIEETEPTWAEKTGRFKGEEKQGEEAGKYRAKAQQEIGDSQLGLSHSGAVLGRMTDIIKNPEFQEMRNKIPFFQDKQLNYLMKTGTPAQKKLIGDFLSTSESFIASTVQGFSGKPLVREFDLAQRQKISPSDPIHVAEGKLKSAIALHDIAEKKNNIISGLLDKGVNLSDAVKQANKMVDVSAIEKRTDELLRDKPTEEDIKYMAEKYKTSPAEIRKKLKAQGVL
jgi:hypothetical protein